MQCFMSSITIKHGATECGDQILVLASDYFNAREMTKRWLAELYCGDREKSWSSEDQLYLFDQIIEFGEVAEIPESDFLVLQKYLSIVG
jgi:hypothetical protein